MEHKTDSSDLMIRYLLGDELSTAEQDGIEESFGDADYFEQFLRAEGDLVNEYIRGRLAPYERGLFEANYLSSARRREKVAVARALLKLAPPRPQPAPLPSPRGKVADFWDSTRAFLRTHNAAVARSALGVLILALCFLLYRLISLTDRLSKVQSELVAEQQRELESRRREEELRRQFEEQRLAGERYEQELRRQQAEHEQREEDLQRELQRRNSEGLRPLFASVVLYPSFSTRGSTSRKNVVVIARNAKWLKLTFVVDRSGDFNIYRVEVAPEASGGEITREVARGKRKDRVTLTLPADGLTQGNYTATVYGIKPGSDPQLIEGYELSIRKK